MSDMQCVTWQRMEWYCMILKYTTLHAIAKHGHDFAAQGMAWQGLVPQLETIINNCKM
jgi:hypothetical protein